MLKVAIALNAVTADGVTPLALESYELTLPVRLEFMFGGNDLKVVEVGIRTSLWILSTFVPIDGEVRKSTSRLPFLAVVTTPLSSALKVNVAFPPPWMEPDPLTVYGPAFVEFAYVNPFPVTFAFTILDERFPNPKVKGGIETAEVPLFLKLTLSLNVAKPYLLRA